jgi:uncharacterized protein (TIGR02246 family)
MEHELRRNRLALADALARGDAAGAASLYAGDCRLLTPTATVIEGRRQIEAFWRAGITLGLTSVDLVLTELRRVGCTAIEIGRYTLGFDGGSPVSDSGKYLVLHRQTGGGWLRAVDVFNPDGPGVGRLDHKEDR